MNARQFSELQKEINSEFHKLTSLHKHFTIAEDNREYTSAYNRSMRKIKKLQAKMLTK